MVDDPDKAKAVNDLYEKFCKDAKELVGDCDIAVIVHPKHGEEGCTGMAIHFNCGPVETQRIAFTFIMMAEQHLDAYQQQQQSAAARTKMN